MSRSKNRQLSGDFSRKMLNFMTLDCENIWLICKPYRRMRAFSGIGASRLYLGELIPGVIGYFKLIYSNNRGDPALQLLLVYLFSVNSYRKSKFCVWSCIFSESPIYLQKPIEKVFCHSSCSRSWSCRFWGSKWRHYDHVIKKWCSQNYVEWATMFMQKCNSQSPPIQKCIVDTPPSQRGRGGGCHNCRKLFLNWSLEICNRKGEVLKAGGEAEIKMEG